MKSLFLAFSIIGSFLTLASGASAATADGPVVEMSPFEVSASRVDFEHWGKFTSPHFIVYTDAGRKEAAGLLRKLEMLHVVVQRFLERKALNLPPAIFVMPTEGSDWRKIQAVGRVEWMAKMSHSASRAVNLVTAQYDWQSQGASVIWSELGFSEISWLDIDAPFWMARGFGSFLGRTEFDGGIVKFGTLSSQVRNLETMGWLPWQKFFEVTDKSPDYTQEGPNRRYDGQCALFVHYMLMNKDPVWTERLMNWAAMQRAGRAPDEARFKEVFGQDWKQWDDTMKKYLRSGSYRALSWKVPPVADGELKSVPVSAREMRELFVLSQILNQATSDSVTSLAALLARGLKTESLRELLVEACMKREQPEAAAAELRALVEGGSQNPSIYALAASRRLVAKLNRIRLDTRLGREESELRAWCRKGLELEPHHPLANTTLAWVEALSADLKPSAIALITEIYKRQIGRSSTSQLIAALALAKWRLGATSEAYRLAQTLQDSPLADARSLAVAKLLLDESETSSSQPSRPSKLATPSIEIPIGP